MSARSAHGGARLRCIAFFLKIGPPSARVATDVVGPLGRDNGKEHVGVHMFGPLGLALCAAQDRLALCHVNFSGLLFLALHARRGEGQ